MRAIRQTWIVSMCFFVVLSIVICSFQIGTARGDFEVSKRQDFCTDDTTFHTNEDIYIKVGVDQVNKLHEGKARLKVQVVQDGKKRFKQLVKLDITDDKTEVSYKDDVQCFFTKDGAWFDRNLGVSMEDNYSFWACTRCHAWDGVDEEEGCDPACFHLMNLGTRDGLLAGGDEGTVPLLGESSIGETDYDWSKSGLRKRLRNNRMPPGMPFVIDESNRNGPDVSTTNDGDDLALDCPDCACESTDCVGTPSGWVVKRDASGNIQYGDESGSGLNAVGLIGAWVTGEAGGSSAYGTDSDVDWCDIAPLFCQPNVWYNGGLSCTYCHYCADEPPCFHTLNFCTEAGIKLGADDGNAPILGESAVGATNFNWSGSVLRARLRNNRMPPDALFVLDESNRNGRTIFDTLHPTGISAVDLIGEWVDAGCPDN